jgi:cyclase
MPSATALLACLLLSCAFAQAQPLPEPRHVRISDRVHVLLGPVQHANKLNQGYMINSTVLVGERGVILVDSGGSLDVGRHILAAVRRITDKPVKYVVNTHHHGDHYLGNAAFDGATFISSEECRKLVQETGADWLRLMERDIGRALPGTRPLPATMTFPGGARVERMLEGLRLVFWVPAGSHTAGDLMVYLPDDGVLIAGDVLVNRIVPTLQDGFVRNWIATLDQIQALGARRFIPGHGEPMTREDVAALRDAMAGFYSGVKRGFKRDLREDQVRATLDLSAWESLERAYVIGRNINRAYLEIEVESFDE